jgi:hypothetical protein
MYLRLLVVLDWRVFLWENTKKMGNRRVCDRTMELKAVCVMCVCVCVCVCVCMCMCVCVYACVYCLFVYVLRVIGVLAQFMCYAIFCIFHELRKAVACFMKYAVMLPSS